MMESDVVAGAAAPEGQNRPANAPETQTRGYPEKQTRGYEKTLEGQAGNLVVARHAVDPRRLDVVELERK